MTTRDIQDHIKDLYDYEISAETVSSITDKVLELVREWQGQPLESVYALIYMDAVFLKMKLEGRVRLESEPEDQESGQEQGDLAQRSGADQAGLPVR
jgi:transposase-like protein